MSKPLISIITPSFNQGQYIEQTILSVIDQDYHNIEYIIIDGGSTDNTVDIIKKYEHRIAYWISEKDNGQPDAINKGLKKVTGDIIAFINSDDYYEPGTFLKVAEKYKSGSDWIVGEVRNFRMETGESSVIKQICNDRMYDWLLRNNQNHQPGNFWGKTIFEKVGLMREELHYSFDWEYWLRFVSKGFVPVVCNEIIFANFRLHNESKTVKHWKQFNREYVQLMEEYKGLLPQPEIAKIDAEIKKLLLNEKISFGRIESINGKFKNSFSYFKEAVRISPVAMFTPKFLFEFLKAMIYMPIRKRIG